jgi:hypothetical protein
MWILLTVYIGINIVASNLGEYSSHKKCEEAYAALLDAVTPAKISPRATVNLTHVCIEK